MSEVGFLTPVVYSDPSKSWSQSLLETADSYFDYWGERAYVLADSSVDGKEQIVIQKESPSLMMTVLKVVSLLTVVLPLIALATKAVLRCTHTFEVFDVEKALSKNIELSENTIAKVQSCMQTILQGEDGGELRFFKSQPNHRVFTVESVPGLIFKMKANRNYSSMGMDDSMQARYQSMALGKAACVAHNLSLLVFPNAKLFTVNSEGEEYDIIAEQRLDIIPNDSAQEKSFEECGASLNEAIRQLAVLIAKTGYCDVEWRNNPVLENSLDADGNRKLAMIDFEHLGDAEVGIFGGLSKGLIRCVNEEQGKIVVEEAKKHMNWTDQFSRKAKTQQEWRKKELADGVKLKEFYATHNIQRGDEQIVVTQGELDFSAYPKSEELQQLALDVIDKINNETLESSELGSVKGRRYVVINTNYEPFTRKDQTRPDSSRGDYSYDTDEEFYDATYLGIVTKKLIELGHIFQLDQRNGHGYYIQA